ncbi:MAG: sigma factor [Nitrospinota bacterium]|jgi:ribosome biogenesis protein Nip4|nr:sigma factor [Nitrospinota bacterium]MDP7385923.1 sigma factor [Nitrospinota bacterium]
MGSETVAVEKESGWERDALARFRKGEVEAFEEFVLHYQDRLYNVVYRMSWDKDETRDVLQDTFLKAFRSLGTFRGDSAVAGRGCTGSRSTRSSRGERGLKPRPWTT